MIRTIVALEQDGQAPKVLVLNFVVPDDDFDLIAAVKAACREFCRTGAGREIFEKNFDYFNWGDFYKFVPDLICQRHGFLKIPQEVPDKIVCFEEQLVEFDKEI